MGLDIALVAVDTRLLATDDAVVLLHGHVEIALLGLLILLVGVVLVHLFGEHGLFEGGLGADHGDLVLIQFVLADELPFLQLQGLLVLLLEAGVVLLRGLEVQLERLPATDHVPVLPRLEVESGQVDLQLRLGHVRVPPLLRDLEIRDGVLQLVLREGELLLGVLDVLLDRVVVEPEQEFPGLDVGSFRNQPHDGRGSLELVADLDDVERGKIPGTGYGDVESTLIDREEIDFGDRAVGSAAAGEQPGDREDHGTTRGEGDHGRAADGGSGSMESCHVHILGSSETRSW